MLQRLENTVSNYAWIENNRTFDCSACLFCL